MRHALLLAIEEVACLAGRTLVREPSQVGGQHWATHREELQHDFWCDGELRQRRLWPSRGSNLFAAQVVVEVLAQFFEHGGGYLQRSDALSAANREEGHRSRHARPGSVFPPPAPP